MKILITGAHGFVGRNLVERLKTIKKGNSIHQNLKVSEIYCFDSEDNIDLLDEYTKKCDFIVNLAGVNRPQKIDEFYQGNMSFIESLCNLLQKNNNKCPIVLSSSIQVEKDNDYGKSKLEGEKLLKEFAHKHGNKVYIYRFANLFGKWSKPNYNSVIATWCHNISRGLEIIINDSQTILPLCYIDDVIDEILNCMVGIPNFDGDTYKVDKVYKVTLDYIHKLLLEFKASRNNYLIISQRDEFAKKLYATYLSYLPEDSFSYPLKMNVDNRGSFTEFLKTNDYGQVSVNISKPGIVKGNHWHNTKNEKFLVVSGTGIIRFRKIGFENIIEYKVSGENLEVIDIPIGYTHNIENIGSTDLVTIMWANEIFDKNNPDTFYEEV